MVPHRDSPRRLRPEPMPAEPSEPTEPDRGRRRMLGTTILVVVGLCAVLLLDREVTPSSTELPVQAPARPSAALTGVDSVGAGDELTVHRRLPYHVPFALDVWSPAGSGPWPIAVFLHGRGRDRVGYNGLVRRLAETGTVVYNASWHEDGPQVASDYRAAEATVACAVRFARATAAHFGGRADALTLIGHDLGASVGATLAVAGKRSDDACAIGQGATRPDSFIGIAGAYDYAPPGAGPPLHSSRLLEDALQDGERIPIQLVHGADDSVIGMWSVRRFSQALQEHGYDAELLIVPRTRHENIVFSRFGVAAILHALRKVQDPPGVKSHS